MAGSPGDLGLLRGGPRARPGRHVTALSRLWAEVPAGVGPGCGPPRPIPHQPSSLSGAPPRFRLGAGVGCSARWCQGLRAWGLAAVSSQIQQVWLFGGFAGRHWPGPVASGACGGGSFVSATTSETPNSAVSREASTQSSSATTSQGYVLPEGKIMPNTVFVGGIDVRMDESEIRSFFARYGSVKEVKIITDRTGVSKGYGFVSFYNDVDVQKIVESQINFHGKKLKLGPAIRKQNLCTYHVQPRPLIFNPPPPPQFQSVWSSPNAETYMQPPTVMNPITQYVQTYPPYPSSPVQVITGYQLPVYNYQMPPQWPAGEQRSYVIPPAYTTVNYHCSEVDPGADILPSECSVHDAAPASGNGPQKKSVDRSIQTVVSCLFNPENRLRNSLVTQDDYFKDKRVHHFRRSRAVLKSDHLC
ncbi:deleted in azoospermia-like [Apodemus sylvaticus]|uniref:deleted in azoospermia-like n=1 Tax=Apodemus sylvaticus TaxID=10129 RepID=UPI002242D4CF|nr:deleted in azoospermia-like [Apodemus sylvaticus]